MCIRDRCITVHCFSCIMCIVIIPLPYLTVHWCSSLYLVKPNHVLSMEEICPSTAFPELYFSKYDQLCSIPLPLEYLLIWNIYVVAFSSCHKVCPVQFLFPLAIFPTIYILLIVFLSSMFVIICAHLKLFKSIWWILVLLALIFQLMPSFISM